MRTIGIAALVRWWQRLASDLLVGFIKAEASVGDLPVVWGLSIQMTRRSWFTATTDAISGALALITFSRCQKLICLPSGSTAVD